ncbi:hypothetical protein CY652_06845 [Burkholderia sp. WAC0059]|uniref:hypothetical protein n=1 Tax=Burkholderia sp. WAC0059 TaxID=2066022 RepID=UPI000C7F5C46|nr:hypothetical protein [Burkholderia sp. WAC0059]PLZ03027.1 hypothetical protein CY652_06845 [Burkholderia sp. WAC0059]
MSDVNQNDVLPDQPVPPTPEEIEDLRDRVEAAFENGEEYLAITGPIDDRYRAAHEDQTISLDDLPFGEERIRVRNDVVEPLGEALDHFEQCNEQLTAEKFAAIEQDLDTALSTQGDVKEAPKSDDEDDSEDEDAEEDDEAKE